MFLLYLILKRFSQLLLELTVFEETFSYRTPCFWLLPLANQVYLDPK